MIFTNFQCVLLYSYVTCNLFMSIYQDIYRFTRWKSGTNLLPLKQRLTNINISRCFLVAHPRQMPLHKVSKKKKKCGVYSQIFMSARIHLLHWNSTRSSLGYFFSFFTFLDYFIYFVVIYLTYFPIVPS